MNRRVLCFSLLAFCLIFPMMSLLGCPTSCVSAKCLAVCATTDNNKIVIEVVESQPDKETVIEEIAGESKIEFRVPALMDEPEQPSTPDEYTIKDFSIVWQMPELPTGCEITALTMALQFHGYNVSKTVMASQYLPTASPALYYGDDGALYGPDLDEYFVGDPFSDWGYICGTPAILTAANAYLMEQGGRHSAVDLTGASPDELYEMVAQDMPVVVWVTIEMADRDWTQGWYTDNGDYVEWSTNDHGAVLIGYTEETVTIADPISGLVEYDRQQFESVFESRGRQCVVIRTTEAEGETAVM